MRPSRPLTVRVTDAAGKPVAGAAVEVVTAETSQVVDPGTTDDRGVARFRIPSEPPFWGVLALKDGVGADALVNTRGTPRIAAIGPPPAEVALTLRGTRTITLRALDSGGRPILGVAFRFDALSLKGDSSRLFGPTRITEVTTDASGVAHWRWVPEGCDGAVVVYPPTSDLEEAGVRRVFSPLLGLRAGRDPERPAPAQGPAVGPGRQHRRRRPGA